MNFYFVVSLAVVFGLPAWWLLLAVSGYRDESSIPRAKGVPMEGRELSRLVNSLITILYFWGLGQLLEQHLDR